MSLRGTPCVLGQQQRDISCRHCRQCRLQVQRIYSMLSSNIHHYFTLFATFCRPGAAGFYLHFQQLVRWRAISLRVLGSFYSFFTFKKFSHFYDFFSHFICFSHFIHSGVHHSPTVEPRSDEIWRDLPDWSNGNRIQNAKKPSLQIHHLGRDSKTWPDLQKYPFRLYSTKLALSN